MSGFHLGGSPCCGFHQGGECETTGGGGGGGMVIGDPITGGTAGRVLFTGVGGVLDDDAALTWIDLDKQLLVGPGALDTPSLVVGGSADVETGFYRPGAAASATLAIALNGSYAFKFGGPATTNPDADIMFAAGRCVIDGRLPDEVCISHRDMSASGQQGVRLGATGATTINAAAGQQLGIAQGNSTRWLLGAATTAWGPGADNVSDLGATTLRVRNMFSAGYLEGSEIADPAAPAADKGRLYFKDNGAGKTQLVARFPTGAVQVIATEP